MFLVLPVVLLETISRVVSKELVEKSIFNNYMLEFFSANAYIPDFNNPNSHVIIKHDFPNKNQQDCGYEAHTNQDKRWCFLTDDNRKYLREKDKENESCDKCRCWSSFTYRLMKLGFNNIEFASSDLNFSSSHGYICNLPNAINDILKMCPVQPN